MLSKAQLSGVDDSGKPGVQPFYVQFNPNEIAIHEAVTSLYDQKKGSVQLNAVEKDTTDQVLHLSMTLFYNTFTSISQDQYQDVRGYIRHLYRFTNVNMQEKRQMKKVCFIWSSICVIGVLEKMEVRYTMFSPNGVPVRAEVSISIAGEYYGEPSVVLDNPSQSEIVERSSFLDCMRDYHDVEDWKTLARSQNVIKARL